RTIPDTEIAVPGFYEVQKVDLGFWSSFIENEKTYQTFIAPSDYSTSELFYVREKQ
ncbi:33645_t:CDS:1, partial [Racocetra persica]